MLYPLPHLSGSNSKSDTEKKIIHIVEKITGNNTTLTSTLADLRVDYINLFSITEAVEKEFKTSIPDNVSDAWRTIADIVNTADASQRRNR